MTPPSPALPRYGRNPFYALAWRLLRRTRGQSDEACLRAAYPPETPAGQIRADLARFQAELQAFTALREAIQAQRQFFHVDYDPLILGPASWLPLLYALIRIQKPEVVIETGCATGTTTALILYGLHHNQAGHLYSLDLRFPDDWLSQNHLASGFLVPDALKTRWTLRLQDTRVALPELLAQLPRLDFFLHDSDHRYGHQMWEYLTAWPSLAPGGLLASDDLADSTAFFDFERQVAGVSRIPRRQRNFGFIVKAPFPADKPL